MSVPTSRVWFGVKKLRATIDKLPGPKNAKRRQALNKRIRKMLEGTSSSAAQDPSNETGGGSPPKARRGRRRNHGQDAPAEDPEDARRAEHGDSDGQAASPRRAVSSQGKNKSPFKASRAAGAPATIRVLDEELVPHEYEKHNRVGKGSFATCFKARACETGETVCLKVTDLCVKKIDTVDVRDEMNFLRRMNHPNCLSLKGYSIDINLIVTMVVEFCPYSLEDIRLACDKNESVRTRIEPTLARKCTSQLIAGVLYLHNYSEQESIAHFDIKPDNVMSTIDGVLKIADFGLAVALKGKRGLVTDGMYRGTDEYMAPEVSAGKSSLYGLPADIWSIGVTFFELIFGRLCKPARESFGRRLMQALTEARFHELVPEHSTVPIAGGGSIGLNEQLTVFFSKCFTVDTEARATIEQLASDPLFQYSVEDAAQAVVKELTVVDKLKACRTRAKQEYHKKGALQDLPLDSSSDSSEDSSSEDEDDEDDSESGGDE